MPPTNPPTTPLQLYRTFLRIVYKWPRQEKRPANLRSYLLSRIRTDFRTPVPPEQLNTRLEEGIEQAAALKRIFDGDVEKNVICKLEPLVTMRNLCTYSQFSFPFDSLYQVPTTTDFPPITIPPCTKNIYPSRPRSTRDASG